MDSLPPPGKTAPKGRIHRLPRNDPHQWADIIEASMHFTGMHIVILYLLAGIGVAHFAWDLIGWLDGIVTGR